MSKEWSFHSAGVLIRNGKIFVRREKNGEGYALPGGHIETGESSRAALVREYAQETGASVCCGRLLWVEESKGKDESAMDFYYMVELRGEDIPDTGGFDDGALYGWLPIESLKNVKMFPSFLSTELKKPEMYTKRFVSNYC